MDELKHRAEEKIGAIHEAAKEAANSSKTRLTDVIQQAVDAIVRVRSAFHELWQHELVLEGRARAGAWARETARRVREGAPPLSPMVLYQELVELFQDHMWRRSMVIFVCGVALGGGAGLAIGLPPPTRAPAGPHARALHTQTDQSVILVEDAVSPGAGSGEVLVRVQAFSVCAVDRSVLRGRGAALRSLVTRGHVTVGRGFAGVVLDVGPGVTDLEMGDEVWGCVSEWSGGAASELLVIRSTRVSKRPRSLSADAAASLPWGGTLALIALDKLKYTPDNCKGKRVVVVGCGGSGSSLIQLLSGWGARCSAAAPPRARQTLRNLGAVDFVDMDSVNEHVAPSWVVLEQAAARAGPWDAAVAAGPPGTPPFPLPPPAALLKSTAPRSAMVELRPKPLITDRLPLPLWVIFSASFYTYRILRWVCGRGSHVDWLEDQHQMAPGLELLRTLVDSGQICPVLDKVYLPQDFESALAHACGGDAVGTTVIRFP